MRQYHFRLPPGFILPGLLGLLILAVVVSVGILLFGIVLAALVVIGVGSALYRLVFAPKPHRDMKRYGHIGTRTKQSAGFDDIPFTDYKEIDSGSDRNGHNEER